MPGQSGSEKKAGTVREKIPQKWIYAAVAPLLAYTFVRSVVAAAGKPFWYDELLTQVVAAQGSWQRIVAALMGPTDGQPPLFYAIEHFASGLCGNQQVALRLPAALGVVCTILCIFIYARRMSGSVIALLCGGGLLATCVFQNYAQEARPYSMVMALIAFAMVCYQRAESAGWVALLGASLALAESLHYLAVLAMVAFGAAELFGTLVRGKVRWGVWAALAAGVVPLAIFWKLLQITKAYYGAHHYYAHFPASAIPAMYTEFFGVNSLIGGAVGMAALAAIVVTAVKRSQEAGTDIRRWNGTGEAILLLAFAALPYFAFVFAKVTHSGMTPRYVLSTVLGIVLAFGYLAARVSRQVVLVAGVFVLTAVGISELHFWRFQKAERRTVAEKGAATVKFFAGAGYQELPVLVPNGGTLLATVYYAFPSAPQKFVYLQRERSADDPDGSDTTDKGLQQVSRYVPIQVRPDKEFLVRNERFLVYTEGADVGRDWVTSRELTEGWTVRVVAYDGLRALYLVSRGGGI